MEYKLHIEIQPLYDRWMEEVFNMVELDQKIYGLNAVS
jgi:hypothetical protein